MGKRIHKDKKNVIEALQQVHVVSIACKKAGVPRATYYRWLDDDPEFARMCDEAAEMGRAAIVDLAMSGLASKLNQGEWVAIKYTLEHNHPRYMTPQVQMVEIKEEDREVKRSIAKIYEVKNFLKRQLLKIEPPDDGLDFAEPRGSVAGDGNDTTP